MNQGTEDVDIQKEIIYFQMAKIFKFSPNEVDKMDFETVLGMLSMESSVRKKENNELKNGRRKI